MRTILAALLLLALLVVPVHAAPSCRNCAPTAVVINGDATVTASTTATPNGGCLGAVSPTKYACTLKVFSATGSTTYGTDGGPTTISPTSCPCTAQFWVHAGQWHAYSAMSAAFTP